MPLLVESQTTRKSYRYLKCEYQTVLSITGVVEKHAIGRAFSVEPMNESRFSQANGALIQASAIRRRRRRPHTLSLNTAPPKDYRNGTPLLNKLRWWWGENKKKKSKQTFIFGREPN